MFKLTYELCTLNIYGNQLRNKYNGLFRLYVPRLMFDNGRESSLQGKKIHAKEFTIHKGKNVFTTLAYK